MALIDGKQIRDATITAAKLAAAVLSGLLKADGSVGWTAAQNANSQRLSNLGAPSAPTDAVRLQDLYNRPWKERCDVATTGNVDLATVGLTAQDGITLTGGERVVVWKQTDPIQNGVYIASAGAWTRSADCDSAEELRGAQMVVERGTLYGDHQFVLVTDDITIGTTALTIVDIGTGAIAGYPTLSNKGMDGSATTADGEKITLTPIAAQPISGSYIRVYVNGVGISVGSDKTKDCYFSGDNGTTARAFGAIISGDTCHFNGSIAGYQISGTDRIDFDYLV